MREAADTLAGGHTELDYSVQSLNALDTALASAGDGRPTTRDAAAYLGEVLIRHGGFAWGWPVRYCSERGDEPALQSPSAGWADVFAWIRLRQARKPSDTLGRFAEEILEYSSLPTEETARKLGWTNKYLTRSAWESLRWDCQRLRARLRASRQ